MLNNVGPIKEETRERVLQAASELGYVPSALAQQFARRKSGNIGVILPFVPKVHLFSTYYFSEILSGIGEAAKRRSYDLLLIFREPGGERDYAKLFRAHKIDALIVLGSEDVPEERAALAELRSEGYPFCLVNQRYDGEQYPTVDSDHVAGSIAAVSHMIERGRRNIAFLNGPEQYSNSADRLKGYTLALQAAGLPLVQQNIFTGNYSRKSGYLAAEQIGRKIGSGGIDAVFAANDRMAIGLMQGLRERGYETGRHYSLVGYDDSDGSRIISPSLSTVAVPFYEMGKMAAARLLDDDYMQPNGGSEQILPVQLVSRGTS